MKRIIKEQQSFTVPGTFQSLYAAHRWLFLNGYSYGSTSVNRGTGARHPVPVRKGGYDLPQKWHNLSKEEKDSVDGLIDSTDYREGTVTVTIYK